MNQELLDTIITRHEIWLKHRNLHPSGRADFSCFDLRGLSLRHATLSGAIFDNADLTGADLACATLIGASFRHATLNEVDFANANLGDANFGEASLFGARLGGSNLCGANLHNAALDPKERFRRGEILKDPIEAYKKTYEGVVIKAMIPAGAIVFGINGRKFRTDLAEITSMGGFGVLHSKWDKTFEYRLGKKINIENFNLQYNVECATGFHFFKTREEAEEY